MMEMRYNYVYFDDGGVCNGALDRESYFYICTRDLRKIDGVKVIGYPMEEYPILLHRMYTAHCYPYLGGRFQLPFRGLWYPIYFRNSFQEKKRLCFIMSGYYIKPRYLRYLKKRFPGCKMVLLHRDKVSLWHERNPEFTDADIRELFDLRLSIDPDDTARYGTTHFDEFESMIEVPRAPDYPFSDVFFAGYAKDRMPRLLEVYHKLTAAGLTCRYYLVGVPKEQRVPYPGIEYADKQLRYSQMLYRSANAVCMLEINQGGSLGYTSRFLEAVMLNKKLITDNPHVCDSQFYNPEYIHYIRTADELEPSFIRRDVGTVDYHYQGEFSPLHLIEKIDGMLAALNT